MGLWKAIKEFFDGTNSIPYDSGVNNNVRLGRRIQKAVGSAQFFVRNSDDWYRSCKYFPGDTYSHCSNRIGSDPEWGMCSLCSRNPYSNYYGEHHDDD